jgi:hypothetical protein
MAQIKTGASAPKSVSSVQAKALARAELAVLLDNIDFMKLVARSIEKTVGENSPTACAKYAVEQALAGIGYTPDAWTPQITARDRSGNKLPDLFIPGPPAKK